MTAKKQTAAKQKAEEIYQKMYKVRSNSASDITKHFAKQCALIAVDYQIGFNDKLSHSPNTYAIWLYTDAFLRQVRSEIRKL